MKILHVFLFFSLEQGGGTVDLLYKIAKAQAKKGHQVVIYTGDYRFDSQYANSLNGVEVVPFKSLANFGFYIMPGMVKKCKQEMKEFDIVHLHCFRSFQNILIRRYANKANIPYIIDAHGSVPLFSNKKKLKKIFDIIYGKKIMDDASKVIAETKTGLKAYKDFKIEDDKIVLLSPPFDTEEFSSLPSNGEFKKKFGIKERYMVLFLGRINWIKGLDFLVESFKELVKQRDDVALVFVGPDDGYQDSLENLVRDYKLEEKVFFPGFVSKQDKLSALVDADVFVQPSRYEEGAWASVEAVLAKTPVIVSANTGAGEDIKKLKAGYLVDFGNKEELCNKINYVFNNLEKVSEKINISREYIINNLSMGKRIDEYIDLYKSCIKEKETVSYG